jgi:hypothetical protein
MGSSATLAEAGSSMTRRFCIPDKIALTNFFVKARKEKFLLERFRAPRPVRPPRQVLLAYCHTDFRIEAEAAIELATAADVNKVTRSAELVLLKDELPLRSRDVNVDLILFPAK